MSPIVVSTGAWGNFVRYADNDVLAFAVLFQSGLRVAGYYHGTQAIEKYLKALALVIDPSGISASGVVARWLRTHDLSQLAERCEAKYPFYGQTRIKAKLKQFSEFDQCARYPWVEQKYGNGFDSGEFLPTFWELTRQLRNDIPMPVDNYPLGIGIREHYYRQANQEINQYLLQDLKEGVTALRSLFPGVNNLVRW